MGFTLVQTMSAEGPLPSLTHLNAAGEVHMVEVGDRPATRREARAEGGLLLRPEVLAQVLEGRAPKWEKRVNPSHDPTHHGYNLR